jgi:Leucine-rich repeat (LRR) protein
MFTLGLEHLNLGGNKLAFKENASQLKKFKKLKSLVLSENRITD